MENLYVNKSKMNGRLSKKGKNPGVVDNWLDSLKMYRKNVAYDETCMFRAVSEQLFDCQVFHERVRKECIEYGRENWEEFCHFISNEADWHKRMDLLEKHMVICGNLEINLISKKYNRDVIIFYANKQMVCDVTKRGLSNLMPLMLCLMDEDHYDAVYRKEHIVDAGFCQSLVYKILYEKVFHITKVDDIVTAMLYEKTPVINQVELEEMNKLAEDGENIKIEDLGNAVVAPFPFKVAKALDPTIYRNIEYDSWGEVRRELRLGDWYYGDNKLKLGTKCVLNDATTNEQYDCYIQEIIKDQNKCVVFLMKTAEKRTVNYSDLSPEHDAKPWPLPYRFSKNLVISNIPQLPPMEKIKNMRKKNKEKRHSKSLSEVSNIGVEMLENVSAYVGVPLQMQNEAASKADGAAETSGLSLGPPPLPPTPLTPDVNRYQWEQFHWPMTPVQYVSPPEGAFCTPTTPDSFVWPTQSQATPYYEYKPAVASAPVTPNVVPYHDTSYPYYYNYHVEQYPPYPMTPTTPIKPQENIVAQPQPMEGYVGEGVVIQGQQRPIEASQQVATPLPTGAPLTPVVYAPVQNEMDMMVPNSPVPVYTPAEMQYVNSAGYVYTPPSQNIQSVPWYQPSGYCYNSQGFIFPQVAAFNQQAK